MKSFMPDKKIKIPFLICLITTIIMLISLFLPYASATEEYSKALDAATNSIIDAKHGLTTDNVRNISLYDFARLYGENSSEFFGNNEGYIYVGIVSAIGIFAALATIFTLFKKGTPIIIFTILSALIYWFNCFDFSFRGVIPSDAYIWGYGCYVFYVAAALTLAGAIWLIIEKSKLKKAETK